MNLLDFFSVLALGRRFVPGSDWKEKKKLQTQEVILLTAIYFL